jgi:hypothetical protein
VVRAASTLNQVEIDKVNGELGLTTPLLTTPLNYLSEDESDAD